MQNQKKFLKFSVIFPLKMKVLHVNIAKRTCYARRKEPRPMIWKENRENAYCEITPAILSLKEQWEKKNYIDPKLPESKHSK